MRASICLFVVALAAPFPLGASENYYAEREEGWFWYQDPPPPPEEEESEPPTPEIATVDIPEEGEDADEEEDSEEKEPEPMSVAWLNERIPEALETAIDDPGPDNVNVRAYAYLQRAAFDKSERFAYNMKQVVLSDPVLDENNRYPIASFGRRTARVENRKDREKRLTWLSENAGLFYFHDQECQYCVQQLPVLERLREEYGFSIMAVSIDNSRLENTSLPTRLDSGQARRFQVQTVPAIVMVFPPDNAAILSQSLISKKGLENRAIASARELELLSPSVEEELGIERDVYAGEVEPEAPQMDMSKPKQLINHIRSELGYEPIE